MDTIKPIVRNILVLIAGFFVANILIIAIGMLGHRIFPPPEACRDYMALMGDANLMELCWAAMDDASLAAQLSPCLTWLIGAFGGVLTVGKLLPHRVMLLGGMITGFLLATGLYNTGRYDAPIAAWVVGILAPIAGYYLARRVLARS